MCPKKGVRPSLGTTIVKENRRPAKGLTLFWAKLVLRKPLTSGEARTRELDRTATHDGSKWFADQRCFDNRSRIVSGIGVFFRCPPGSSRQQTAVTRPSAINCSSR